MKSSAGTPNLAKRPEVLQIPGPTCVERYGVRACALCEDRTHGWQRAIGHSDQQTRNLACQVRNLYRLRPTADELRGLGGVVAAPARDKRDLLARLLQDPT